MTDTTIVNGIDVATIAANMMHEARNGGSVEIGSGVFNPAELKHAAQLLRAVPDLIAALEAIVEEAGPSFGFAEKDGAVIGTINRLAYIARTALAKAGAAA